MKRSIYFHIGTHKTGTTSIQQFLRDNKKLLNEKNISVFTPDEKNLKYLAGIEEQLIKHYHSPEEETIYQYIVDPRTGWYSQNYEYYENKLISKLQRCISSKKGNVIISSEGFYDYHPVRLNKKLDIIEKITRPFTDECEINIIIYFRKQDSFIEAMYYTLGKYCFYNIGFNEFLNQFCPVSDRDPVNSFSLDWNETVLQIREKLPKANVIFKSFDIASREDLINDFKNSANLPDIPYKYSEKPMNLGLNKHGMEIMMNSVFLDKYDKEVLFRSIWTDTLFMKSKIGEKYYLIEYQDRVNLFESYYSSNKNLFSISDDVMKNIFAPSPHDTVEKTETDSELFSSMVKKIVALKKKTLWYRFIVLRRNTIDKFPPTFRLYFVLIFLPFWKAVCKLYWFFSIK